MAVPILTGPEPIGIGTAACECLTSYIQRLAQNRGVAPIQILYRVLTWCEAGKLDGVGQWRERPRRLRTGNFNGFKHADAWLRAVQRATMRADLHYLTTRAWDENFPTRGFLSPTLKWCPLCLAADEVPYHRLVWLLQACRCCATHEVSLIGTCPRCAKPVPAFHERSIPTKCQSCGFDVRLADPKHAPSEFDLWCARELESIVATSARLNMQLAWNPSQAFRRIAREAKCSDTAAIGRRITTSKVTVWYWLHGRARPNLSSSLAFHYAFGASLAASLGALHHTVPKSIQPEIHLTGRNKAVRHDWGDVKRTLEAELAAPTSRSLRQISAALNVPVRTIRAHFPELCGKIVAQRHAQQRRSREDSDAMFLARIRKAASNLTEAHLPLTPKMVEKKLLSPGLMNLRGPRRALNALKRGSIPML